MKKLLGLFSLLIYFVSTNAIIHAQSMNILPGHGNMGMGSCHSHHTTTSTDKQSADCCELVYSNDYSHTNIQTKIIQTYTYINSAISLIRIPSPLEVQKQFFSLNNSPPGRNPDNKYNTFSDLTGIIVNLA